MKKIQLIQILAGALLLILGLGIPVLKTLLLTDTTYLIILMTESLWLTAAFFGAALLISGIINKVLGDKKANYSTIKTEIYSHTLSAAFSIGVYSLLLWLIIDSSGLKAVNGSIYTASVIITIICMVMVFLLIAYISKERKSTGKTKGIIFDIITFILYLLPFFFLSDTIYKIIERLQG